MDKKEIQEKLFSKQQAEYGPDYRAHLLEQYKLFVDSADKISDRRQKTNDFFLAVNTALVTFLGYFYSSGNNDSGLVFVLAPIAGFAICYLWYRIVRSYKQLNGSKLDLIHLIENELPLKLYDAEWDMLGKGEDSKKYLPFTHIEIKIPWVFIILYIIIFIAFLLS